MAYTQVNYDKLGSSTPINRQAAVVTGRSADTQSMTTPTATTMPKEPEATFSTAEAAEMLDCSPSYISVLTHRGKLDYVKTARGRRPTVAAVEHYLLDHPKGQKGKARKPRRDTGIPRKPTMLKSKPAAASVWRPRSLAVLVLNEIRDAAQAVCDGRADLDPVAEHIIGLSTLLRDALHPTQ